MIRRPPRPTLLPCATRFRSRRIAAATPSILSAAAEELADFGAPQASLSVVVAQVSGTVGRGFERAVTVSVA